MASMVAYKERDIPTLGSPQAQLLPLQELKKRLFFKDEMVCLGFQSIILVLIEIRPFFFPPLGVSKACLLSHIEQRIICLFKITPEQPLLAGTFPK